MLMTRHARAPVVLWSCHYVDMTTEWMAHLVDVLCSLNRADVIFVIKSPHGGAHVCECILDGEGTPN